MKPIRFAFSLALILALLAVRPAAPLAQQAASESITVQVNQPGAAIPSTLFGIFFEDINFAADGGIYPERVKNRSFEFAEPLMGWKKLAEEGARGSCEVRAEDPLNANSPHYLRLKAETDGFGLLNEGFRGIGVKQGETYTFSTYARSGLPGEARPKALKISVVDANGKELGRARLSGFGKTWKRLSVPLRANATEAKARLKLTTEGRGTLDLDHVSLFPVNTYGKRPNGLRPDLVQLLKDLKPGFIRFPGGCIVEGRNLAERYQWKTTIGDPAARRQMINRWNLEFRTRNPARAPEDYFQSFGLGFYEYFQLCEDTGAEPLPILNCGMACQFNTGELVPLAELDPYIQDALDLIEFANGPTTSTWGGKRAELGHPAPFNLKMLGIGNEQWGPQYVERYAAFAKAIKAKHPEIKLISSAGPSPQGERFDFLWKALSELQADFVDEHYYQPPKWFLENVHRYDHYPRTGPKVFAGEYAAHVPAKGRPDRPNNWEAALAEAAFMTGLERNADVVLMASYAPLFAHVEAWQWSPNLIWFDNLRSFGTPSYYVQQLFSANRGTQLLPAKIEGGSGEPKDLFVSASLDTKSSEVILKVVNTAATPRAIRINLVGAAKVGAVARAVVLASNDLSVENSLDAPKRVAPVKHELALPAPFEPRVKPADSQLTHSFAANSLTVLRVPLQ